MSCNRDAKNFQRFKTFGSAGIAARVCIGFPWYECLWISMWSLATSVGAGDRYDVIWIIVRVPRPDFGPYPALRVKVFFFADSDSLDGMLQFPGG